MTTLKTFVLPEAVTGRPSDHDLADRMIHAWRTDGVYQVETSSGLDRRIERAFQASQRFFGMPPLAKARCVSDLTYSGHVAPYEEVTGGQHDNAEVFTICKDIPLRDPRVRAAWACHGPVPWPDEDYQHVMRIYMDELASVGERLIQLTALGLALDDPSMLTDLTTNGWHHMRVLRFPAASATERKGIGAHTEYGLLVIIAQDDVGGLYIRPPVEGERRNRNWLADESSAGMYEDQEPWTFVNPVPRVLIVFPGDFLQFMTDGYLLSTPSKVKLNTRERHALAYFHEPNFAACVRRLFDPSSGEHIHYGTHFTNMFMRCYPQRITTHRIHTEDRLAKLALLREAAAHASRPSAWMKAPWAHPPCPVTMELLPPLPE